MGISKHRKRRIAIFALEILVLSLALGVLYLYTQISTRLDKMDRAALNEANIQVNEEVKDGIREDALQQAGTADTEKGSESVQPEKTYSGYKAYALFGIDHRDKNPAFSGQNSDTMIVAVIDHAGKEIRLASLYRDTLVNVGNDTYSKANAAYAMGGPERAISMLNTNLDLDIHEYVTVDFSALAAAVDAMGGLDIPLSYAEIVHMNNYCVEVSEETGKSYTPVELPERPSDIEAVLGTYHLNGVQVTSYCRIRYTASLDMGRTERQRRVIQELVMKAKNAGLTTLFRVMDEVFPLVSTNIQKTEILSMIPTLLTYGIGETTGCPVNYKFSSIRGDIIVPTTLSSNVSLLHDFLYGTRNYAPSSIVKERSDKIIAIVGGEENIVDTAPQYEIEENTADDTFLWQDNGSGKNKYEDGDYSGYTDYVNYSSSSGSTGSDSYTGYDNDSSYSGTDSSYGGGSSYYHEDSGTSDHSGSAGYGNDSSQEDNGYSQDHYSGAGIDGGDGDSGGGETGGYDNSQEESGGGFIDGGETDYSGGEESGEGNDTGIEDYVGDAGEYSEGGQEIGLDAGE